MEEDDGESGLKGKTYVHVRVQQRNGRKSLTTVQARPAACALRRALAPALQPATAAASAAPVLTRAASGAGHRRRRRLQEGAQGVQKGVLL